MKLHSRPSRLGLTSLCPGWWRLLPEEPAEGSDSEDAAEGTLLHKAVHDPETLQTLSDEQKEAVGACQHYLQEILDQQGFQPGSWITHTECPVALVDDGETITEGTEDLVAVNAQGGVAVDMDWKFGRQEIPEAAIRLQLLAYAGATLSTFGAAGVRKVIAVAFQPRIEKQYRLDLKLSELGDTCDEIRQVISMAERPELILRPSPEACVRCYCPCISTCPAARGISTEIVPVNQESLKVVPISKLATLAERAHIAKRQVTQAAEFVLDTLKERIKGGERAQGWRLQFRSGKRKIDDPREAYTAIKDRVSLDSFLSACEMRVGALEEAWSVTRPEKQTKKTAKQEFERALGDCLGRGEDTVALVRSEEQ